MMQMLKTAGIPILSDVIRQADSNNPKGYFELEAIKKLEKENNCLLGAQGKAVKVISHLLKFLPVTHHYKIILMTRNLSDIIQSQNRMLQQLGKEEGSLNEDVLIKIYQHHLSDIKNWLVQQHNMQTIEIVYEELLREPELSIKRIIAHLEMDSDMKTMIRVIDQSLNHSANK